jgi:hypothetical protein
VLTRNEEKIITEALRHASPSQETLRGLERCGDVAFDSIKDALLAGSLSPRERINGLRRLSFLSRQACFERKEEVLALALDALKDSDLAVRSGAANMVIGTTLLLERSPHRIKKDSYKPGARPSLREQMQAAVSEAAARGLDPEQTEYAQEFLANKV